MIKAKDYMSELKKLFRTIENKYIEKEMLDSIAHRKTSFMGGDRVQSSGNKQSMETAIIEKTVIETEIEESIKELSVEINKRIQTIERLSDADEYNLLHKVYIQDMSLSEVAASAGKSYSTITTLHGRALANVQKILDER